MQGAFLKEAITALRDARIKQNLKSKDCIELQMETDQQHSHKAIESILARQVNAQRISYGLKVEPRTYTVVVNRVKFHLKTDQPIDTSLQKGQLQKDLDYLKGFLASVERKLSNKKFVQNAKPEVIEIERKKQADAKAKIKTLEESIAGL